jgi:hypothetical protein
MLEWVVIYRRHLRQSRKSRALPLLLPFNIPTCKCAVRIPDASSGPSNIPTFGFPYLLPSSVSRNPFVCRSCEKCRGVYQQFPIWNEVHPAKSNGSYSSYGSAQMLSFQVLAHSFALFCIFQKLNSFVFKRFRTLCAKTRGWGVEDNDVDWKSGRSLSPYILLRSGLNRPLDEGLL